jgi:hypothetical protein
MVESLDSISQLPSRSPGHRLPAIVIFVLLLSVYHLNGDFTTVNDATYSTLLPSLLLTKGQLAITPTERPNLFLWEMRTDSGTVPVQFRHWDDTLEGHTYSSLRDMGILRLKGPRYFLVTSLSHDAVTGEQRCINTFGLGAGLSALPVFAVLYLGIGDPAENPVVLWYGAKFAAAALVAGSAALVFLTLCGYTSRGRAALVALAYGLGTCVWSISSQALWQHGPNEFFLSLGTYFLTRPWRRGRDAALSGLAYTAAVACRPTSAVMVLVAGVYLLCNSRRHFLVYCAAGLPIIIGLGYYHWYFLGSPLLVGRDTVDRAIALEKTGSPNLWQTPIMEGAAGLLYSPSRGLLTHSPFMVFALVGLVLVWWDRRWAALRPLSGAVLVLFLVACKFFDWWGGWCFGYRPIVDTMPFLAVLLLPALDWLFKRKAHLALFGVLLAWSVGVQVVGAFAYEVEEWNARLVGYLVMPADGGQPIRVKDLDEARSLLAGQRHGVVRVQPVKADIDDPQWRSRLWSLVDNQILYFCQNFAEGRRLKHANMRRWLGMSPED